MFELQQIHGFFYIFHTTENVYHRYKFKAEALAKRYMESLKASWLSSKSAMDVERRKMVSNLKDCTMAPTR